MSDKEGFHLTFKVLLRLLFFIVITYFLITLLSSKKTKEESSSILGDVTTLIEKETDEGFIDNLYQQLPSQSREKLENFKDTQTSIFVQEKVDSIKNQLIDFPNEQIKEIKKAIVQEKCEEIIRNIDEN